MKVVFWSARELVFDDSTRQIATELAKKLIAKGWYFSHDGFREDGLIDANNEETEEGKEVAQLFSPKEGLIISES